MFCFFCCLYSAVFVLDYYCHLFFLRIWFCFGIYYPMYLLVCFVNIQDYILQNCIVVFEDGKITQINYEMIEKILSWANLLHNQMLETTCTYKWLLLLGTLQYSNHHAHICVVPNISQIHKYTPSPNITNTKLFGSSFYILTVVIFYQLSMQLRWTNFIDSLSSNRNETG
jgi:hypothetical protein